MLFFHSRSTELLQRVIRAAVASDSANALSAFLASHGDKPFAQALSGLSGPVIADALSLLTAAERIRVLNHVSRLARNRLRGLDRPSRAATPGRARALCWLLGYRVGVPASPLSYELQRVPTSQRTAKRCA